MKKRRHILGVVFLLASSMAFAQSTVKISGAVEFVGNNRLIQVIQLRGFESTVLAETTINADNTYALTVSKERPGAVYVNCCQAQDVYVWIEDEDMQIDFRGVDTFKVKTPSYVYIRSGAKNELMNMLNFVSFRNHQNMKAISRTVEKEDSGSKEIGKEVMDALYTINYDDAQAYYRYLLTHYSHLTSCAALFSFLDGETTDPALIDKALANMEAKNPHSIAVKDCRKSLEEARANIKRMQEGEKAPRFVLPDEKGKKVDLESLKGKVVVVDFWASWCKPCRMEIPVLKKYYEEFKNREVVFLSISIDTKKANWKKAMKEENMPWRQLLAPDSGKEIMAQYQFNGIPFIVVIDQNGRIFRKNLRGEAIRTAIIEALSYTKD